MKTARISRRPLYFRLVTHKIVTSARPKSYEITHRWFRVENPKKSHDSSHLNHTAAVGILSMLVLLGLGDAAEGFAERQLWG
jgi:hypothetical protein